MKKTGAVFIALTAGAVLFIAISLFSFNNALNSHRYENIETSLKESVEPNIVSFSLQMQEQIKKVKTFSAFLSENWDADPSVHLSLLRSAVTNNGLLRCAIAYPDGSFITHDNKNEGNVSNDPFFIANLKGEFFITDPRPAVVDASKTVILFAAPIFDQAGNVLGSVIYSYLCDDLDQIFNLKSAGGEMNMVVIKSTGELLIGDTPFASRQGNVLAELTASCTHEDLPSEQCIDLSGESGTFLITHSELGETLYVRYDKLEYNDWYMLATITEKAAGGSIDYVAQMQRRLSLSIALGVAFYLGLLLVLWVTQNKLIDRDTGALTLYGFKKKAKKILKAHKSEHYVVVKLDIKGFKLINRIHSFSAGNKVLKNVSQALTAVLAGGDSTFARVDVDGFVLLLPYTGSKGLGVKRREFISIFRELMSESFSTKVIFPTGQYVLKPSDFPTPDIDEIFEKVNFAHRAAKQRCDVIIDYEEDIENTALFEKTVEDRMESAISDGEFTLYLQPKVRLSDETICGAEALVRWKIGDKYYMYPTDFIPVLEKNGFIVQLDKYMFRCAAQFIRECIDRGMKPLPISVNFSRHHLNNEAFVNELCAIAEEYKVPHKYLEIEITESAFLGQIEDIVHLIDMIHAAGFLFSMDDFGSGYSCFAQLKDLKVDILKIDRGFFEKSEDQARAQVVIAGILKIAQELNITTVAEGIEEKPQIDMLKRLGCDIVQGYYYAKPMPAADLDIENFTVQVEETSRA